MSSRRLPSRSNKCRAADRPFRPEGLGQRSRAQDTRAGKEIVSYTPRSLDPSVVILQRILRKPWPGKRFLRRSFARWTHEPLETADPGSGRANVSPSPKGESRDEGGNEGFVLLGSWGAKWGKTCSG